MQVNRISPLRRTPRVPPVQIRSSKPRPPSGRDIPETGLLPSIPGGERQWEVAADGEPVAVITQSWTGARWWPEPEWLVDPETPFTGERVTVTLRESQTR